MAHDLGHRTRQRSEFVGAGSDQRRVDQSIVFAPKRPLEPAANVMRAGALLVPDRSEFSLARRGNRLWAV